MYSDDTPGSDFIRLTCNCDIKVGQLFDSLLNVDLKTTWNKASPSMACHRQHG
jgi:hypothetical protein